MCVSTMGRRARVTALFRACALIYWRHGPLFADAREQEGGRGRGPARERTFAASSPR